MLRLAAPAAALTCLLALGGVSASGTTIATAGILGILSVRTAGQSSSAVTTTSATTTKRAATSAAGTAVASVAANAFQAVDATSLVLALTSVFSNYTLDFGDVNDMASSDGCGGYASTVSHTYSSPGLFELTLSGGGTWQPVRACSANGTWSAEATASAAASVAALAPGMTLSSSANTPLQLSSTVQVDVVNSSDLSLVCPRAVAWGSQFECALTSYRKDVSAVADFGDGTRKNFTIGDLQPEALTVGWQSPYYDVSPGAGSAPNLTTSSKRFVIPEDGKLFAWQFTSGVAGACEFVIFRPQCANTTVYCYRIDACIPASQNCSAYDRTSGAAVCTAAASSASFSLSRRACNNSRATASSNAIVPKVANFTAVSAYFVQATAPGCTYQRLPVPATVLQGDSVGLNTNNCSVRQDVFYGGASPNSSGYDFHLQAHIVRSVTMKIKHAYWNCSQYTVNASLPAYASERSTDVVTVWPFIYDISFVVRPATYQATADAVNFTVSIVRDPCAVQASFKLIMGPDYQRSLTTTSTNVSHSQAFMRMDEYLVTACAANDVSQACANMTLVVQDRIAGVSCNFSSVLHPPQSATMYCDVASGSDVSWSVAFDEGPPVYFNASYALGQSAVIRAARNRLLADLIYTQCADNATYRVTAFNMISSAGYSGSFISLVLLSGVTLDAIPPVAFGQNGSVTLRIASGCHLNVSSTLDQMDVPLFQQQPGTAVDVALTDSLPSAAYRAIGRHSLAVRVKNALSEFIAHASFDVDYPLSGLSLSPNTTVVTAGVDVVSFRLTFQLGSRFNVYIDYGDGTFDRQYFGGNATDGLLVFSHAYTSDGVFAVSVALNNSLGSANATCRISSYFPAVGLSVAMDTQNQTAAGNFVTLLRNSSGYVAIRTLTVYLNTLVIPRVTNASYALDYGDGSPPVTASAGGFAPAPTAAPVDATLQPIASWTRAFSEGGRFAVRLVVSNPVSSVNFTQWHTVFSQVTGVAVSATYVSPTTTNVAFGNDETGQEQNAPTWPKSYFPLEVAINFSLAVGRGNFLSYRWDFGDNTSVITASPAFQMHQYAAAGNYAVTLSVSNNASSASFTAFVIVQSSVDNLRTRNSNGTNVQLLNTPVTLVFDFGSNGTDACYLVDFDVGLAPGEPRYLLLGVQATCDLVFGPSSRVATQPLSSETKYIAEASNYTVTYIIKGMKNIQLTGANMVSSYTYVYVFAASDILCGPPMADATKPNSCNNGYTCVSGVRQVYKSVAAVVKSTFTIDCQLPTSYQLYTWTIFQIQTTKGMTQVPVSISGIGDLSGQFLNALVVPAHALDVGRYVFYVNVSVATTPPMSSADHTTLDIVSSPIVTGLPGGPVVRMGSRNVTFDALSMSYDPDQTNGSAQAGITFSWLCRRQCETYPTYDSSWNIITPMTSTCSDYANASGPIGTSSADRGCFYDDGIDSSGVFTSSSDGQVTVDLSRSYPGTYIYVQVTASKGRSRSATYEQAVFITEGDPPMVQLRCVSNCLTKFVMDQSYSASVSVASPVANQKYCARWYLQNVTTFSNTSEAPFISTSRLAPYLSDANMIGFGFSLSASAFSPADRIAYLVVQVRVWPVESKTDCSAYATYSNSSSYGIAYQYLTINDVPAISPGGCGVTPTVGESFGTQYAIGCGLTACQDPSRDLIFYNVGWRKTATDQWIWYFRGLTKDFSTVRTQLPEGDASNNNTSTLLIVCYDVYGSSTSTSLLVQVNPTTASSSAILDDLLNGQLTKAGGIAADKMMNVVSAASFMSQCNTSDSTVVAKVQTMTDFITASLAKYPQTSVSDVVTIQTALKLLTSNIGSLSPTSAQSAVTASASSINAISTSKSLNDAATSSSSVFSTIGNLLTFASTSASSSGASDNAATSSSAANNQSTELIYSALSVVSQIGSVLGRFAAPGGQEVAVNAAGVALRCGSSVVQGSLQGAGGALSMDGSAFDQGVNGSGVLISHRVVTTTNLFASSDPKSQNTTSLMVGLQLFDANNSVAKIKQNNESAGVSVSLVQSAAAPVTRAQIHVSSVGETSLVNYKVALLPNNSFFLNTRPMVEKALLGLRIKDQQSSANATVASNRTVLFEVLMAVGRQTQLKDYDFRCSVYVQDSYVGSWTTSASSNYTYDGGEVCSLTGQQLPRGTSVNVYYSIRSLVPIGDWNVSSANNTAARRARRAAIASAGANSTDASTMEAAVYSSACAMLDESTGRWTTAGCQAESGSTPLVTQCKCSNEALLQSSTRASTARSAGDSNRFQHFFGAAFSVPVNTIDFSHPFWASLEETPIVFAVMISVCCIYLCCCVWSVRQDRDDEQKAMSIMLLDNHPLDEYLYEVAIATGSNVGAGTTSKVCITFVGSASETPPRLIAGEDQHAAFRRGAVDSFIMAVPEPLGDVTHVRVWLCYEGQNPSWWLSTVTLTDVQTAKRWTFLCNSWLSYEKGEGLIDRILPAASSGDMSQGSYLFRKKTSTGFMDSHPWFSVIGRPRRSSFTRTQRLTCCLALLYTMMAANVLFYGQEQVAVSQIYSVGPLKFTTPQIIKGFYASLVVLPVNMLIATLFRKSEKRRPRSQQDTAKRQASKRAAAQCKAKSTAQKALGQSSQPRALGDRLSRRGRRKFLLPWWCAYVGYVLSAGTIAAALFYTVQIGTQFGEVKAEQWLMSFFTSFFTSLCFVEPCKIVVIAMLYVIFIRKPIDHSPDPTQLRVLESGPPRMAGPFYNPAFKYIATEDRLRKFKVPPQPINTELLHEMRQKAQKEEALLKTTKDIVLYTVYITILFVIVYGTADPLSNVQYSNLKTMLSEGNVINDSPLRTMEAIRRFSTTKLTKCDVNGQGGCFAVESADEFWLWVSRNLIPTLYGMYVDQTGIDSPYKYISDQVNVLVGPARLRQVRSKSGTCPRSVKSVNNEVACIGSYDGSTEETGSFRKHWSPLNLSDPSSTSYPGFRWNSSAELGSRSYIGEVGQYSGGGYAVELGSSAAAARARVASLVDGGWIDEQTRAIFAEFLLYNPGVSSFAVAEIAFEKLTTGAMMPKFRTSLVRLDTTTGQYAFGVILSEVILFVYYVLAIRREVASLWTQKSRYFKSFWNSLELIQLLLISTMYAILGYQFYLNSVTLRGVVSQTTGEYFGAHKAAEYSEAFQNLLAVVIFVAYLKFVKILSFNKVIRNMASALKYLAPYCVQLLIVVILIILAFNMLFYGIFGSRVHGYETFMSTFTSLMLLVLNKTNFTILEQAEGFIGPLLCAVFIITINFFMINFLISMVVQGLSERVRLKGAQNSSYDFGKYFFGYLKSLLFIDDGPAPTKVTGTSEKSVDQVDLLDLKIQKLSSSLDLYAFAALTIDDSKRSRLFQQRATIKEISVKTISTS